MASSFLSRWTGKGEQDEYPDPVQGSSADMERPSAPGAHPVGKGPEASLVAWSASPSLENLSREFEAQMKTIEEARRYLEDRISPFQRHLAKQRRNTEQALKQLDARMQPLRQYLEGQEQNLGRVGQHLNAELRDQFDTFGRYLSEQQRILEMATGYLDEQPRPMQRYIDDQQRIVELIYKDVEEKLEPLARFLKEQQRILETIATPMVLEEFASLASFMQDRERAFERYALSLEHRPAEFLAELDEIHGRYKAAHSGTQRLLQRVLEETRLSDDRLREALRPPARALAEMRPGEEPQAGP